jgi:hypothetical protein
LLDDERSGDQLKELLRGFLEGDVLEPALYFGPFIPYSGS